MCKGDSCGLSLRQRCKSDEGEAGGMGQNLFIGLSLSADEI